MTSTVPFDDRPTPVLRGCDGTPWPSDDDLEFEAEWAAFRESADVEWRDDEEAASVDSGQVHSAAVHLAPVDSAPVDSAPVDSCGDGPARVPSAFAAFVSACAEEWEHVDDPLDADAAARSDIDARLGHLERIARDRQRATADEYRLILAILDDAVFDPTPWVGPDPTLDRAWNDPRGRTSGAVRRDRIDLAERAAVAEIAVRLRLSEQTVRTRAAHARTLVTSCPRLWTAFTDGSLSEKHAVDAARLASTLPSGDSDAFQRFDEEACPPAVALTPAKFAVAARAIRENVHAESLEARHRRAAEDRAVWMRAELDGMASLHALLPADRARSVMSRLDQAARHLRGAPDEERTLAQLRADAFADLVTMVDVPAASAPSSLSPSRTTTSTPHADDDGAEAGPLVAGTARQASSGPESPAHSSPAHASPPATPSPATPASPTPPTSPVPASPAPDVARTLRSAPPATVVVTIPALTLLGHDSAPATLEGYGPIDLDTARRLAGNATSWIRLLTHPVTGAPLVLDRKTYRVPVALRRWLGVTSPTCVFPGCGRAARECDIDHLTAWSDGGTTDDDNLDPKCRHHHRLRHESRWDVDHPPGGDTRWISPLGGRYGTDPPPF